MELDIALQLINFAKSVLFGFAFFVIFDMFRIIRSFFKCGAVFIFFQDVIYFISAALSLLIFFFAINSGEVRIYILFGVSLGWLFGFFTYGKLSSYVVKKCRK